MPTQAVLDCATARLRYRQLSASVYHVDIDVWSHSYDHPDPGRRSALVTGVSLIDLPSSSSRKVSNVVITDRDGIEQTRLWALGVGATEVEFGGYTEYDTGGLCGAGIPNVIWCCWNGIYDERCAADPTVDAYRLRTYNPTPNAVQLFAFNYVVGPVKFSFDVESGAPPSALRLKLGHIGGNGGDPAQRGATLPNERFIIKF